MGLSKPTSTPTMWKVSVLDLCACARHVGLVTGGSARGKGGAATGAGGGVARRGGGRQAAARGACGQRAHLEGRGDGKTSGGVAVEDVHELLLLDRADHHGAAARVGRHKLAGHDAAAAGLAVDLGVDPLEAALIGRVLHDDDLTRVRTHDDVVAAATCERHLRRAMRDGVGGAVVAAATADR